VNHKQKRTDEDRAPTEARNSQKIPNILERNTHCINDQEEWDDSGEEEAVCTSSDSSSIVCLDRGDEDNSNQQISTNFNTVLFTGLANWQKSAAEKLASSKQPCHYSRHSVRTMYRNKSVAKKNGQTLKTFGSQLYTPKTDNDLGRADSQKYHGHRQMLCGRRDHTFK